MPLDTNYPGSQQTFEEQFDTTVPGAEYPNTQSATIMALEGRVGYDTDVAGDATHEGRLLTLEGATPPKLTLANAAPANLPLQVWIDTSDPAQWTYHIQQPDNTWVIIGANAVSIMGRTIDTAAPANGDVLVWDASLSKVKWSNAAGGFNNPLTANQDILIGTTPVSGGHATLGRLGIGANGKILGAVSGALAWIDPPVTGMTNPLTQTNSIIRGGTVTTGVAAPTELAPGSAGQVLTMITGDLLGWSTPTWISAPSSAVQGSVLYYGSDNIWHQLAPGVAGQYLRTQGTGADPGWYDLPVSSPGSAMPVPAGSNTGDLLIYITPNWTNLSPGTAGTWLHSNGPGVAPSWGTPPVGMTNPMSAIGDTIYSTNGSGAPGRLAIGTTGQILTVSGGVPTWATYNPFTVIDAAGDLIVGTADNTAAKLAIGTTGQILTVSGGVPTWATYNPFTIVDAAGDLIVGTADNTVTRLAKGSNGQVLSVVSGALAWVNNPSGFTDPMTTSGDIIIRDAGNTTARLGIGSVGAVLTVGVSSVPVWAAPSGGSGGDPTIDTFTTPVLTDMTQINLGVSDTVAQEGNSVHLKQIGNAGGNNTPMLVTDAPVGGTGHWQYTVAFRYVSADGQSAGIFIRQSSSGKFGRLLITMGSGIQRIIDYMNSPTSYGGGVSSASNVMLGDIIWLRVVWDGTNTKWYISADGFSGHWSLIGTYAVTSYGWSGGSTPDGAGFFCNTNGVNVDIHMTVWHSLMESIA